ncbi:uncharacterized protein LOC111032160 isoform X2 [Myzus persicae]|uniref:uncharacterized protein LOC111032160 isoform X2 n=1 Tax=Myzus persicae TaxID=13164 RepID=UPI000B9383C1|nr:uncharacterized protein LOC111032160 isoform X2 [Myzus persicae]
MGCVQSLFNPSKSRSPSPEREFEPPKFETVPVTRQPKKNYNTSSTGISVADDRRVRSGVDYDTDSDDEMALKCDDFDSYAMGIEDDLRSVHYVEATALTTLAANSSTVAILGTTAKCKSAGPSPAIRRQQSSSPSPSTSSLPLGQRPQLIGSVSQDTLESNHSNTTSVRELASEAGTIPVLSSTSEKEPQALWLSEAEWTEHLATKAGHRDSPLLATESVSPPSSPSPFLTSSPQWPMIHSSVKSNLDRIPVGVIEVLDCAPADQRRPPPTKAQRLPKAQRATRGQNIPLPVIHAMERKPNSMGHEELFKTMMVQPPSSDKHGYRSRMATGSNTFDSSSRKPLLRQSNESKFRYTEDDFSAATEWMINMPVFEKCPPAKSKSLPSRESVPSSTTTAEGGIGERQHGVLRGSSLPSENSGAENSPKPTERQDDNVAMMVPIALECATVEPVAIDNCIDTLKKSDTDDKADENHNVAVASARIDESNVSDEQPIEETSTPEQNKEPDHVQSDLKPKIEIENTPAVDQKNEKDSKDQEPELDTEYRLTMIHSVREAVNRICEQAVEKTAAIVRNRGTNKRSSNSTLTGSIKDRDESEAADNASSEFSLPPPPQQHPLDSGPTGQESSWPPPPSLSEAEEERTIAPGYSFDLPDPPTEMDQMDSETDKLDISDEEMKATGLPSDDDEQIDAEAGDGGAENGRPGNEIDAVMKSTANGGSSDGSVAVAQDNGADDRAATTIQAVYRGFRARKYVEAVNAAAVKIQAGFRGYRVRQSLKNAAPSTTTTTTDESQCWSDDDQKSVVSVTYTPLKEYGCEPRGAGDGRGDGDDGSDDGGNKPNSGVGNADSVSGVPSDVGGGGGDGVGGGDDVGLSGVGTIGGAHVVTDVGVSGVGVYEDDDDELQTGDDEVFERDDNDINGGGGSAIENPATNPTTTLSEPENPTTTLSEPENPTKVSTLEDAAEAEALVQAAIKIQARVRGFAARKRLNDEKNDGADKK